MSLSFGMMRKKHQKIALGIFREQEAGDTFYVDFCN
jgi:hypothetical protein